jgi:hypothetical protein
VSNLAAIALILAILLFAFVAIFYGSHHINGHIDAIYTGVLDGIPMSTKHRYLNLSHMFLQQTGAIIALSAIVAIGFAGIADNVADPAVTRLAYVAAGLAGFGAVSWMFGGVSCYFQCVAAIRRDARDKPLPTVFLYVCATVVCGRVEGMVDIYACKGGDLGASCQSNDDCDPNASSLGAFCCLDAAQCGANLNQCVEDCSTYSSGGLVQEVEDAVCQDNTECGEFLFCCLVPDAARNCDFKQDQSCTCRGEPGS